MSINTQDHKRIAKNTVALYFRMILVLGVTLYTSRVVIDQLGLVDYGVYTVVAGIVALLGFLNGSISTATQRFLAVALTKDSNEELSQTFQTMISIHLIIGGVVIFLAETVGLWFLYNYINIPPGSYYAAFWVYQCSILMAVINIITIPYISLSIAHERMKIYAYLSILEVLLKLSMAFLLIWIHYEKLILYALLTMSSSVIIYLAWSIHTRLQYPKISNRPRFYSSIGKGVLKFVGWQTYGSFSYILRTQGINLLLNIFFGPILNAARGIAVQVNSAMMQFVQNFQMAVVPQINKQYAQDELTSVNNLIMRSSKLSFLLMFVLSLPILMETKPILVLWIKDVPEYGVLFVQLIIVVTLTELFSGTLIYGALATGNIKNYQLILSSVYLLTLPIIYLYYKFDFPPQTLFYIEIILNIICLIIRLIFLHNMIGLHIYKFIQSIIFPELCVVIIAIGLMTFIKYFLFNNIIVIIGLSFITSIVISFYIGLQSDERNWVKRLVKQKIHI